ncbi:MAG: hypothetical protein ACI9VN_002292 [Patescibacteria group bacterium]
MPTNNLLNTGVNNTAQQANGCADNFPDGGSGPMIILTDVEYQLLSDQYDSHKTEVGILQTQWSASIDNGSTTNLVSTIEDWQGTGSALKTDLLSFSPHLSTSALIATLSRSDILNNDDLFDILIQNPDELRKGFVAEYTGPNTSTSPAIFFPAGSLAALEVAAQQDFTVRSETEALISGRKAAMTGIADKVIRSIMADYANFDADLYRDWLSKKQSFESELAIIESVVGGTTPSKAIILLDDLEQNENLNNVDQQVFDAFRDIIEIELLLMTGNKTWYDLDSTEINELELIADSDNGIATAKAKGILSFFYDYYFEFSVEDLESLIQQGASGYSESPHEDSNSDQVQSIRVYPTPARDQVTIQLESPLIHNSLLTISNLKGEVMKVSPLLEGGLQFQISTKELPVGIFYYQVVIDGENKTGKIVISK